MNYEILKKSLPHNQEAENYIAYLQKLQKEQKRDDATGRYVNANPWFDKFTEDHAIHLFKKVAQKGLAIDGDTVLITCRGINIYPEYTYHAYKNLVSIKFPETTFDFDLVYNTDEYSFRKDSGKVSYTHIIGDPFNISRVIVGAYGIIKNSRGEFIELINMKDIESFRNSAKNKTIWNTWFDRMVKKSIIKRICTVNFKDIVSDVDKEDNENYDPDLADVDNKIQELINSCQTIEELTATYNKLVKESTDTNKIVHLCSIRKNEINANHGNH